ncbi:MAG TPA: fumarylacetoacetate hydrolase family protein [Acidimicrobiales bacterium]|nr:fumarylacetoacetate hydrolase family protein [Acidimicrobiales bacterium]
MRLATVRTADGTTAARVEDGDAFLLPFEDVGRLLASGPDWADRAAGGAAAGPVGELDLAPLVPSPSKILCVGLNYLRHLLETGRGEEVPSHPTLFAKFADALTGPYDDIALPAASTGVDWEAELVVVVGSAIRGGDRAGAAAAIAGFTVGNDVSMRDWQRRTTQWLQGKTWEASSPVGPFLVTPDEVGGPTPDLAISCLVDGEIMQDARTSDLLFDPVDVVAYASTVVTLRPGDLIFTGTPDGVGGARQPPVFIRDGQVVTTRVEGVGEMVNRFVADAR